MSGTATPSDPEPRPWWEIADARVRVLSQVPPPESERIALAQALDRVLAADVTATVPLPGFDNSAMDGYALGSGDPTEGSVWKVTGEQPAGIARAGELGTREAWRVFTGAPIPPGTTAVVMQEDVEIIADGQIRLTTDVEPGEFIRLAGTDVCAGQVLLRTGRRLTPMDLGLLASQGVAEPAVHRRPPVHIISTGDECRPPGEPLAPGEIHETNGLMLAAMAIRAGADPSHVTRQHVADNRQALRTAVAEGLQTSGLLVISGGVSVGRHDHVRPVLEEFGCRGEVHKLRMKPGKPFFFARHPGGALVFGLPGNPVSSAVTFHLLVAPAIRALLGLVPGPVELPGLLNETLENRGDRPHYLRMRITKPADALQPLPQLATAGRQSSDALGGLARSDGLLPVEVGQVIDAGSTVGWFPWDDE